MRSLTPKQIQAARERLGMSQDTFAETFHISVGTVRNWEQGKRSPSGAAAALLWLLTKIPDEILGALRKT